MGKRIFLVLAFTFFSIFPLQQCLAAPVSGAQVLGQSVGVVLIGDGSLDFKGEDFYAIILEGLKGKFGNVSVGDEPQGKWRSYWDSKGYLIEQPPKRDDLFAFAKETNYSKVLFLVIPKPVVESSKFSYLTDIHRVTLDVRAMLIQGSSDTMIGDKSTVQRDSSESSIVRAKRGALTKAMEYFVKNL